MLRNLGYISRDDGEPLEGFKQENDMISFVVLEDCSESIMGINCRRDGRKRKHVVM